MILDKVLEIYQKYYICIHCLGRMFSLLGSSTTNYDRGSSLLLALTMENHKNLLSGDDALHKEAINNLKILAENANYIPSQKVLINEGLNYVKKESNQVCYLCNNIFFDIHKYIEESRRIIAEIEYDSFLVGSTPSAQIINREDRFKTEFNLLEAESFKSHFNRVIGKKLTTILNKVPKFNQPDVLLIISFNFETFSIELTLKSLFIFGKYNKFIRGIPQTHWFCKKCMGEGCELCNYTGKQYQTTVEELISPEFLIASKANNSKFHGAGREDIDVRMLGSGRPFILELRNPKIRNLNLNKIERQVNKKNRKSIKISDLKYSNKKEVIRLKSGAKDTKKVYKAIVEAETKIDKDNFNLLILELKKTLENQKIYQRTPYRVSHRRADKVREKIIFQINCKYIKPNIFEFTIETQGGTYIKELISGDEGRTSPSFSEIFKNKLVCKELDVIEISL
ncbi:MAG: tRNA pseudouridine(54/55) synthase Pus10 [Promethearchaeota archaeon]